MANKTPPSFNLYHTDFRDGCRRLTREQIGAYILLLIEQFEEGILPRDARDLGDIVSTQADRCESKQFAQLWLKLSSKFEEVDEGFINPKMAEVREKTFFSWTKKKENGSKGGRPKKPTALAGALGVASLDKSNLEEEEEEEVLLPSKRSAEESIAVDPPTDPPKPDAPAPPAKRKPSASARKEFEEFWKVYPRRKGKRLGRPEAIEQFDKVPTSDLAAVMTGVKHYAEWCNGDGDPAKDAFRWLRDKRWTEWQEPAESNSEPEPPPESDEEAVFEYVRKLHEGGGRLKVSTYSAKMQNKLFRAGLIKP